jgi:hypothetical protein
MIKAFLTGIFEFKLGYTTRFEGAGHAYDLGREWAHKMTFRYFEQE